MLKRISLFLAILFLLMSFINNKSTYAISPANTEKVAEQIVNQILYKKTTFVYTPSARTQFARELKKQMDNLPIEGTTPTEIALKPAVVSVAAGARSISADNSILEVSVDIVMANNILYQAFKLANTLGQKLEQSIATFNQNYENYLFKNNIDDGFVDPTPNPNTQVSRRSQTWNYLSYRLWYIQTFGTNEWCLHFSTALSGASGTTFPDFKQMYGCITSPSLEELPVPKLSLSLPTYNYNPAQKMSSMTVRMGNKVEGFGRLNETYTPPFEELQLFVYPDSETKGLMPAPLLPNEITINQQSITAADPMVDSETGKIPIRVYNPEVHPDDYFDTSIDQDISKVPIPVPISTPNPNPTIRPFPNYEPIIVPNPWGEVGNPGPIVTPTGLNWEPLTRVSQAITNKFPFSIPWDFKRQLDVFNVQPLAPKFNVDIKEFVKIGDLVIPLKFALDLSNFNILANLTRWGLNISFDIALILSLKRWMPK